ncbi:MAG: ribonuclease P protein component [Deltaproteobacteria bacterium]|nr:ribonuclease P protein component [Deltaproteobacteria bacterium]
MSNERSPQGLPRTERVLLRSDFLRAQSKGRRQHGDNLVLLIHQRTDDGPARLGCTTSRKVGNSVVRHKIRRWVREIFRRNKSEFMPGCDSLVIVRDGHAPESLLAVETELLALARKAKARASQGQHSAHTRAPREPRPHGTKPAHPVRQPGDKRVERAPLDGHRSDTAMDTHADSSQGTGAQGSSDPKHRG